jgi:hypothetical protein
LAEGVIRAVVLDLYNALLGWLVATVGDGLLGRLREDPVQKALRDVVGEAVDTTVAEIAPHLDSEQAAHLRSSLLVPARGIGQTQVSNNEQLCDALNAWVISLDQPEFDDVGYLTHLGVRPALPGFQVLGLLLISVACQSKAGGPAPVASRAGR